MRQLFVPACLCLMTLAGSTVGGDPTPTFEKFAGAPVREKESSPKLRLAARENEPEEEALPVPHAIVAIPPDEPIGGVASDSAQAAPMDAVPLPKSKPEIKPVVWRSREEICESLARAAEANNLPAPFFIRLLFQESGFHPGVVSPVGAQGIAQFMPGTAADMGVDNPFDPLQAIPASARLLRNLFQQFGNLGLAAAAYNAGPKRIQDWLTKKGVLPQETQGYVKTITGRPAENWKAAANGAPAVKLPRHAPCQEAAGLLAWNGPEQIPVPAVAPHRRMAEPAIVVATAATGKGAKLAHRAAHGAKSNDKKLADKTATAKSDDKQDAKREVAVISVATKPAAPVVKTAASGKGALQLAARKRDKHDAPKKVRLSSAK